MNITYIILAHKNPRQLQRLVNVLSSAEVKFVIHVDKRADIGDFMRGFTDLDFEKVFFLEQRCESAWGSFELVQAVLNALGFICSDLPSTDRIVLLSGQDYPIKGNRYINKYLAANPHSIFMEYDSVPYRNWKGGGEDRFPLYAEISEQIKFYGGSQWMSFPLPVAEIILDFLAVNPDFIRYFKLVRIPDESFFQTLLLNCGNEFVEKNLVNRNLHLIKWEFPYAHPKYLGEEYLNMMKKSRFLFARKLEASRPSRVLDRIDCELLDIKKKPLNLPGYAKAAVNKEVVLFLTNKSDPETLARYNRIKETLPKRFSLIYLRHEKRNESVLVQDEMEHFIFDDGIMKDLSLQGIFKSLLPGSNHFPLFGFYRNNPYYKHYWVIEDDVYYHGDIGQFFDHFRSFESDFISSHIRDYCDEPKWHWWYSLQNNKGKIIPVSRRLRSFNPIYRISNRAIYFLDEAFKAGWSGHHEVAMPTLLKEHGFLVEDFGGNGSYVREDSLGKFYQESIAAAGGELDTGSMRYRPVISKSEINNSLLYHPLKT
ncbi:beta-1,6-N-acetylglucosaminyltransferase [Pedobacter sp. BG31]|uniref:beta-1,6-N-acetylglucosaminyltransferase n=1 Tax=Pedobacter sp. BG31 TaxID=3349697 RepID=UPI0035F23D3A